MLLSLVIVLALVRARALCRYLLPTYRPEILRVAVVPVAAVVLLVVDGARYHVEIPRQHHLDESSIAHQKAATTWMMIPKT